MKKIILCFLITCCQLVSFSQPLEHTLLWRISGNGLTKPSYLFGTIHMVCGSDLELSDSLKSIVARSNKVYFEIDLDNIFEMMGAFSKMKMRNDTTLKDLLTQAEYEKVKSFFAQKKGLLPFSMVETYKPMLTAITMMESGVDCNNAVAMEQIIMKEAKQDRVGIKGLETMAYQISIFDSIPYQLQAKQLLSYIENYGKQDDNAELSELTDAYRNQDLQKLEELTTKEDMGTGMENFQNLLLYNRNANWVKKLQDLLPNNVLLIAVGAGHLPGTKGVIQLLRKAGYTVEPVENRMYKKNEKII